MARPSNAYNKLLKRLMLQTSYYRIRVLLISMLAELINHFGYWAGTAKVCSKYLKCSKILKQPRYTTPTCIQDTEELEG